MDLACRCHGFSGSCSLETCWRELPTPYDISEALKKKYNEAVKVEVSIPRDGSPASLRYRDPVTNLYTYPPDSSLVYVEESDDFCTMTGNFTRNRHCMPEENLPSQDGSGSAGSSATGASYGLMPDLREVAMAEHFPACETFCCNGEYVEEVKTVSQTCNCRFVWCCDVVCDTCTYNVTEYRCTGWSHFMRNRLNLSRLSITLIIVWVLSFCTKNQLHYKHEANSCNTCFFL